MSTDNPALNTALAIGLMHLREFLKDADKAGLVVEVRLVPRTPLAMGEYDMVADVRPSKAIYRRND